MLRSTWAERARGGGKTRADDITDVRPEPIRGKRDVTSAHSIWCCSYGHQTLSQVNGGGAAPGRFSKTCWSFHVFERERSRNRSEGPLNAW